MLKQYCSTFERLFIFRTGLQDKLSSLLALFNLNQFLAVMFWAFTSYFHYKFSTKTVQWNFSSKLQQ